MPAWLSPRLPMWRPGIACAPHLTFGYRLCRRNYDYFSSSAGTCHGGSKERDDGATLKSQLRHLFKLIHPDLFQNQPVEQAANQASFQLLQEYLTAIKEGASTQQANYHFVFFIRENRDAEKLRKVELLLPPPPQGGFADLRPDEVINQTMGKAINQLLAACGLSSFIASESIPSSASTGPIRLLELFQQASEIQRRNEASAMDPERELAFTKNALRLGRGIRVSFRPPMSDLSAKHQIESLQELAAALDMSPDVELSGHALLIGDCYGVDALGNIWLRHEDNKELWSRFLSRVDIEKASKNRKDASLRQGLELKAARAMEVEMVFTDNAVATRPDYTRYLDNLIDEATHDGAVGSGKFSHLPIRIVSAIENDKTSVLRVDETLGYIAVPLGESLHGIYRFIEKHGHKALEVRLRLKERERHVEQVKLVVRKKLRLRHLVFDRKLSDDMCITACMRLLHFAPELEEYMEGLSLCVSDEHKLPIEGSKSLLHLKWNFKLSEL